MLNGVGHRRKQKLCCKIQPSLDYKGALPDDDRI